MKLIHSIPALRQAYLSGELTPRSLIESIGERESTTNNPNIWIHRLSDAELEPYLKQLESTNPSELPLYGVPFAIKDNIDLEGVPTTAACEGYTYTPSRSAKVVEKLITAGAIPIGKANLDQFATGLVGVRTPFGTPVNPCAREHIPGGSSSGSAVAVAEGLVSFSLGTDTAGSGRIPAAFNRLWGVKPSRGLLSTSGVVPACRTLDCVSIFANTAEDAESVLSVCEGFDPLDCYSQRSQAVQLPKGNKLGIPSPDQLMFFGDVGYQDAWLATLDALRAKGWEIQAIDFSPFLDAARLLYDGPWVAERYAVLEDFFMSRPTTVHPVTKKIIEGGSRFCAKDTFRAQYTLAALKRRSEQVLDQVTALVTPTAGGFPTLEEIEKDPIGLNSKLGYYTNFMNLLDLCALATPGEDAGNGLPFGITWMAPRYNDKALLELASSGPQLSSLNHSEETLPIVLFGAHMSGLSLNHQVTELGATLCKTIKTAPIYRMVCLPSPQPERPGVYQVADNGESLTAELWHISKSRLGEFLERIHQPLGLGEIVLSDGEKAHGFLCEAVVAQQAEDISSYGGWRGYIDSH